MKDKVVNMDFASLYPTQQKWYNIKPIPENVIIRKVKIKRLFNIQSMRIKKLIYSL